MVTAEEVSVYDIKDHSDFKFRPGNTVLRVAEPQVLYTTVMCED